MNLKSDSKSGILTSRLISMRLTLATVLFTLLHSFCLQSQIFYKNIYLVPTYDKSKESLSLILNKQPNYGTVIDELRKAGKKPWESKVDSAGTDSRAIKVIEGRDKYYVRLSLRKEDYENPITISVYNLLGNKVMEVYRGMPYKDDTSYEIPVSELPKGVFICNAVGKGFRLDSKFIVTR